MAGSKAWYYTALHYVTDEYTYEVRYQSSSKRHIHYWKQDETEYIHGHTCITSAGMSHKIIIFL